MPFPFPELSELHNYWIEVSAHISIFKNLYYIDFSCNNVAMQQQTLLQNVNLTENPRNAKHLRYFWPNISQMDPRSPPNCFW